LSDMLYLIITQNSIRSNLFRITMDKLVKYQISQPYPKSRPTGALEKTFFRDNEKSSKL